MRVSINLVVFIKHVPNNDDIGARIQQLFPSINRSRPTSAATQSPPRPAANPNQPTSTLRGTHNPYRFTPGRRAGSAPGGSFRRQSKAKAKKVEKPIIKDVILLPDPRMSAVPRGRIREELFVRKRVGTAVEIYGDLLEEEMASLFQTLFSAKIATIHAAKKFEFVRIVGNRIVEPQVSRRFKWFNFV